MVNGSNWINGAHAGSPPKWRVVGVRIRTAIGKNATTAAGPSSPTSHGPGVVITMEDGPKSKQVAAGVGCRAEFGRHPGSRGAKARVKRVLALVGLPSLRKPRVSSMSA
jgi:hypothetical protein